MEEISAAPMQKGYTIFFKIEICEKYISMWYECNIFQETVPGCLISSVERKFLKCPILNRSSDSFIKIHERFTGKGFKKSK